MNVNEEKKYKAAKIIIAAAEEYWQTTQQCDELLQRYGKFYSINVNQQIQRAIDVVIFSNFAALTEAIDKLEELSKS